MAGASNKKTTVLIKIGGNPIDSIRDMPALQDKALESIRTLFEAPLNGGQDKKRRRSDQDGPDLKPKPQRTKKGQSKMTQQAKNDETLTAGPDTMTKTSSSNLSYSDDAGIYLQLIFLPIHKYYDSVFACTMSKVYKYVTQLLPTSFFFCYFSNAHSYP